MLFAHLFVLDVTLTRKEETKGRAGALSFCAHSKSDICSRSTETVVGGLLLNLVQLSLTKFGGTRNHCSRLQSRCANAGTRYMAGKALLVLNAFSLKETSLQVSYRPSISYHRGALSICLPAAEGPIVVLNNVVPLFTMIFVDDQRRCPVSCPLPKRHNRTQRSKIVKMVDKDRRNMRNKPVPQTCHPKRNTTTCLSLASSSGPTASRGRR